MSKTIVVTGGAGFIGSSLTQYLIQNEDAEVVVVDKLTYASSFDSLSSVSQRANFNFVRSDIADRTAVDRVFEEHQPDAIIHLAAESHVDRSITTPDAFIDTNIVGTYTLLEATREYLAKTSEQKQNIFRFLHVSTDEVFGSLGSEDSFREDTPYDPSSPYSASKAASDHLARAWHRTYGLPVIVSNCSNNYGPCQFPEKLIPLMILNGLEGKKMPVYGNGSNIRDWIFVEDHARALLTILKHGRTGHSYNVGGSNEHSNIVVVRLVCDLLNQLAPTDFNRHELIEFVPDRPGHDMRYAVDTTKIETELGWKPSENFESGMEQTVKWYLANREWWQPLRESVYSGQRLGLA